MRIFNQNSVIYYILLIYKTDSRILETHYCIGFLKINRLLIYLFIYLLIY